jgi:flagellar motor switch protein FliN/FliY
MTPEQSLLRLGASTAEAIVASLAAYCGDGVSAGATQLVARDASPVAGLELPAVAAEVSYVDGVTGGTVFLMPLAGVRALAAAMGAGPAGADAGDAALTELELSAAGEAANQMMAAAAGATGAVLGHEVEIAVPRVHVASTAEEALGAGGDDAAASVVATEVEVLGHPCRLLQIVPHAFTVRMTRALDDLASEYAPADDADAGAPATGPDAAALPAGLLGGVGVRVWAELGRASMPIRRAVGLPAGAVVDLDRALEDPIDLYVNGRRFATGRLVTVDGGDWAVRIDAVDALTPSSVPHHQGDR